MVCPCCGGGGWWYWVAMVVVGGTVLQWWWLAVLGCCDGQLLLLLLGIEEWVREGLIKQERGERKKYKIIYRRVAQADVDALIVTANNKNIHEQNAI